MLRSFAILFAGLLVFLSITPVIAQDNAAAEPPIGSILDIEGDGNIIMRSSEEGKAYPAKLNDQVYRNDVVQTGPGSSARMLVVMIDGSRFTLGADSKFKIDEYAYDDTDTSANMARYNIAQGVFLYTSGLMTKKSNPDVKIATPYGSIGIRGTSVWGGQLGDQYGVYVGEGEVSLESKRGHILITEGQGTSIRGIKSVAERPHALPPEILAAAKSTVALNDLDKIKVRMAEAEKNYPAMIELHKQFIHSAREDQLNKGGSVRRQGPGVLKIEQDRQDQRMKIQSESEPLPDKGDSIMNAVTTPGSPKPAFTSAAPSFSSASPATPQMTSATPAAPVDTGPKADPKTATPEPTKKPDPF